MDEHTREGRCDRDMMNCKEGAPTGRSDGRSRTVLISLQPLSSLRRRICGNEDRMGSQWKQNVSMSCRINTSGKTSYPYIKSYRRTTDLDFDSFPTVVHSCIHSIPRIILGSIEDSLAENSVALRDHMESRHRDVRVRTL